MLNKKISIRIKALLSITTALLIFGIAAATFSYNIYLNASVEQHKNMATGIAQFISERIDVDKIDNFLAQDAYIDEYNDTKKMMTLIRETAHDVEYIYVYKILPDGCHVVFDLDSEDLTGNAPGTIQEFDESFEKYLPTLLAGEEIEPIITDDTYGWLLTAYQPVKNSAGETICYVGVDVSMDDVRTQSHNYLLKLLGIFFGILIVILFVDFQFVNAGVIKPINKMAQSAEDFAFSNAKLIEQNLEQIKNLKIHTGDEIENLYRAFVKMTEDSVRYIDDVKTKNKTISNMQDALIITLADLVESRDENTGQHIKKTAAYVKIILDEMKAKGVYSDQLTEQFASNVYKSAPLHDIGKISVPDSILNKPGKLTNEEFDIMKTHTTAGGKILNSIIEMVPGATYLYEAKNLATYHHERWDGRGYPTGLKETEIPLSARIMAVADVFDALVSKRSYKEGFPPEKAMNIIIEESGTHFDPKLVEIFVGAQDKVFKVAKDFGDKE